MYLQRFLQSYACSASQFRRRYPKPYIKLRLIKRIFKFSAKSEYEGLDRLLKAPAQREFESLQFFELGESPAHKG